MKKADEARLLQPARLAERWPSRWAGAGLAALNLLLLGAWVWLYRPVFQYLGVLLTREEFRTNQIVLAGVAGLLLYRMRRMRPALRPETPPRLFFPGLALLLAGSLGFLLCERFLDINTLSASLFVLASYGLAGLWMDAGRWKQGFPVMLLVVGVLPFGAHLETFLGYPLRLLSAEAVRSGMASLGFHAIGVDTILVFESGVSQVDIPCSGVKSLWTGALFLLAATWIENRPLNLRWLLVALATGALLVLANFVRVGILTLIGPALGWTEAARMLHVPLGVLGFAGACAAAVHLLGRMKEKPSAQPITDGVKARHPAWLSPVLLAAVLAMALLYAPRPAANAGQPAAALAWVFPQGMQVQPLELTVQEMEWIRQDGAERADRYAFTWHNDDPLVNGGQPVAGTLMLVSSQTWRGQHRPERCFQVFGLTISESFTYLAAPEFPLRHLSLSASGVPGQVSAVYWLQSPSQTTEDYAQRIWGDLSPERERWVLVTVLFERDYVAHLPDLNHLLLALHGSVDRSLMKGSMP